MIGSAPPRTSNLRHISAYRRACLGGLAIFLGLAAAAQAEPLSPQWEDLTSADLAKALAQAQGVCILPMGSLEKNGPAQPIGANIYVARAVTMAAVKQDYAVVFPQYYVAGVADVSNHQGAIAYSDKLQHEMLEETVSEMGRNGCSKILIVNGHSGNNGLLQDFIAAEMERPKPYVVYAVQGGPPKGGMSPPPGAPPVPLAAQPSKPDADGHGGEERAAILLAVRPDLVHVDRAHDEPVVVEGSHRLPLPGGMQGVQTGVSRAVEAPGGYLGDPSGATAARGRALIDYTAQRVVMAIRAIKADTVSGPAQQRFFQEREHPQP